jgi:hypothetical protein
VGKTEELDCLRREKEAKANALMLGIIRDLSYAEDTALRIFSSSPN